MNKEAIKKQGFCLVAKNIEQACMEAYALCVWEVADAEEVDDMVSRILEYYERKYKAMTRREYIDEICKKWKELD